MVKKKVTEVVEQSNPEHDTLLETLKFTPRTYKIQMWGYGGEKVMGTVDRKIYDYFKSRRLDLSSFAWDHDYAEENNIPEDMWPFPPGSWYECDSMAHVNGVSCNAGTVQITDEQDQVIYERRIEDISGFDEDDEPEMECFDEMWIGSKPAGTVVFIGSSNEKGTFFEGEIPLTAPFDITKLKLMYEEVDGEGIVNTVFYNDEDVENYGGSTDGKSSDFGMYLVKDSNTWEKYTNMDDIEYPMTDWFPKKIKPVREGVYMVRTAGKNPYTYQCKWTGSKWVSSYVAIEDYYTTDEVKIKEWQGLAQDPDADWDPVAELDKIISDFAFEQAVDELVEEPVACFSCGEVHLESELPELAGQLYCPDCQEAWVTMDSREYAVAHETGTDNPVDFPQTGWPFAGPATTKEA